MSLRFNYHTRNHDAVDPTSKRAKNSSKRGCRPPKYSDEMIKEMRDLYATGGVTMKAIALDYQEKYGMNPDYAYKILKGECRINLFR